MIRTRVAAAVFVAALALSGCGASPATEPVSDAEPAPGDAASPDPTPCVVGTWQLDVPDYAAQIEAYVLGLRLPIVDYAMAGGGTVQFTADGLVATEIDLTITGTIVADETQVPLNSQSAYSGSRDWATGGTPDTIDLANWANVPDPTVPTDPAAPAVPAIDYTDIPSVTALCSADTLVLQAPDAPVSATWHR